ncbi:MAG TPA: hypothetical protein VNT20_20055 [Flavisolibacter sp.]|jgi:hypothetical protein|nr:hypothetical protein [Flavisolibacter sp.]
MNYDYHQSPLSKAILTSVFVGFFATIVCLIYNIIFRESTGYKPADFINVSSLIFAVNLIFLIAGLLYFFFLRSFRKGDLVFEIIFGVLTIFCAWRASYVHMENSRVLSYEFRTLLIGTIIIMGVGIELVPLLFHNKKFEDAVL